MNNLDDEIKQCKKEIESLQEKLQGLERQKRKKAVYVGSDKDVCLWYRGLYFPIGIGINKDLCYRPEVGNYFITILDIDKAEELSAKLQNLINYAKENE